METELPSKVIQLPGTLLGEGDLVGDLDRAAARLAFLSEASRSLGALTHYESSFEALAKLLVPYLADWCTVSIIQSDGQIERVAVAHVDPEEEKLAKQMERRFRPEPDAPVGVPHVLRTRNSEWVREVPEVSEWDVQSYTRSEGMQHIVRRLGVRSYITVPLLADGEVLGAIFLATSRSGRLFDEEDLRLAEDLAARAAMAVFHLKRYELATQQLEKEQIRQEVEMELLRQQVRDLKSPLTAARLTAQLLERELKKDEEMSAEWRISQLTLKNLNRMVDMLGGGR